MLSGSDVALARLSEDAYLNPPTGIPAGFTTVTQAALGLNLGSQETFSNGVYNNRNGAALVTIGVLNGVTTAVLAFRGSDNRQDSINDLQNINVQYQLFPTLIAAFDGLVAKQGITQVEVTGHSLGGAMAQLFMTQHADNTTVHYLADTFGSPGALIPAGADARINNLRIADDPAVYLGENRASVGSQLQSNPALAAAAVFTGPEVFPGLTYLDVIDSIPKLNTNYVNRGTTTLLPNADGSYTTLSSLADAASAGKSEHVIPTYVARIEALTGSTGDDQSPPGITPTTTGVQIFRFFDANNGTHFYTASASERDMTISARSDLTYEGVGLNANTLSADPSAAPVFRFFDTSSGSHFYTANADEKTGLQNSRPDLKFEGIAFYENASQQTNDTAVYRFFDTQNGTHFYTPNQNEFASVIATRGDMVNEGVAFFTQKS